MTNNTSDNAGDEKMIRARVGTGLVEVLQLDDEGMLRHLGIYVDSPTWDAPTIVIVGSVEAMRRVLSDCEYRQGPGFDDGARYAAICKRAHAAIVKALKAAGESERKRA